MTQPSAAKSTQDPHPGRLGENGHPRKALGFRDLVMFYVVATLSLRWIPFAASAGPSSLVIWLIGLTTIFIPLALCIMELSCVTRKKAACTSGASAPSEISRPS